MLEVFYKIMSKVTAARLTEKFDQILSPGQFGFRPGKRASQATVNILNTIINANNNKKPLQIVALDAKAAFDTLFQQQ